MEFETKIEKCVVQLSRHQAKTPEVDAWNEVLKMQKLLEMHETDIRIIIRALSELPKKEDIKNDILKEIQNNPRPQRRIKKET